MVFISKQVDYGAQFLIALAHQENGEFLSVKEFSKKRNISFLFLQKIVRSLRSAGFIESSKGAFGGYRLRVDPSAVTLKNIVEAIEGEYQIAACMKLAHECPITQNCLSKNSLQKVQVDIISLLDKYSLQSMV